MNFRDKVFLISGTSSGIGKACAEGLLDNEAIVIGMDINQSSISHKKYIHYMLDVRDENKVAAIVDEVDQTHGKIGTSQLYRGIR